MATTIRTDIDDKPVTDGFKRIAAAASSTSSTIQKTAESSASKSANAWVKYADSTYKASKTSAEGLGFISSALGRINPQLALVGEQTVRQLPTIMAWGSSLAKWGLVGGAMAAIGGAASKIAFSLSQINKDGVGANSELGKLVDMANSVKPGSFAERLLTGTLGALGVDRNEINDQQRQDSTTWKMDEEKSGSKSGGNLFQMNKSRDQQQKIKDYTSGVSGVESKTRVSELLELEQKRIEGLRTLEALTDSEAEASQAYTDALKSRYEELDARIDDLRESEKDFANEQKALWIDDIKTSEEAKKAVERLTGEYRAAYRNDKLSGDEKKQRLGELSKAQGQYNKLLADEKQNHKDIVEAIRLEVIARREARMEAEKERQDAIKARANELLGQQGGAGGLANEVRVDPKMIRKARAAASQAVKQQVAEVQQAFADEMEAADRLERGGINVDEQRKEIRQRRNQGIRAAKAGRGDREQDELMDQQKNILDRVVANGSLQLGQGQLQLEINQEAANQIDQNKRDIIEVQRQMAAFLAVRKAVGRAANNQQRLQR